MVSRLAFAALSSKHRSAAASGRLVFPENSNFIRDQPREVKGFTCPELTAECCAEPVKITMVTNLTSSPTVAKRCGIPEDEPEHTASLKDLQMTRIPFDLCLHYENIMAQRWAHLSSLAQEFFFKAHLCTPGKGIHAWKCPRSSSAVRSLAGPQRHSCSSSRAFPARTFEKWIIFRVDIHIFTHAAAVTRCRLRDMSDQCQH